MTAPVELTTADVAALIGVGSAKTVRDYRARGAFPEPDRYVGATPVWRRATVLAWMKTRPGQGARTDLRQAGKGTAS